MGEDKNTGQVTFSDVAKHYLSSIFIYGTILVIISFCPAYTNTIGNESFDYINFFVIYFLLYLLIAPAILFTLKPKSVLQSKSIAIMGYIKRQIIKSKSTKEFLQNIEPTEIEKQAFMTIFVKAFFGVYCVITLCSRYLPNLGYNLDFLKVLFFDAEQFVASGQTFAAGMSQFILDTSDVWLKLIFTVTTFVFAISYLTELNIFKNKIKSVDTTPLGVLSCIICYYPVVILTDKFIQITDNSLLPVANQRLLVILNVLAIFVNLIGMLAVLRLGTKSGNLTNRGIVNGFPYNIIRHPDYTMRMLYVIITAIPLYLMQGIRVYDTVYITAGILVWIYIYYIRSITEERHLIKDPEYQQYTEKVKYRFIPKLF